MPVSTRKSLARADDNITPAQDITTIMNELAADTEHQTRSVTQSSPAKRQRTSDDHEGMSQGRQKLVAVEVPTPAGTSQSAVLPSARRASGRLQSRLSLRGQMPIGRRNQWDVPEDAHEDGNATPQIKPVKKSRALVQNKVSGKSPFKGKGTLKTISTASVNLDDSPLKTSAPQGLSTKISASMQGSRRPLNRTRKLQITRTKANKGRIGPRDSPLHSSMAVDPFEEAQKDDEGFLTPGFARQPPPSHQNPPKEFSPLKRDRRAATLRGQQPVALSRIRKPNHASSSAPRPTNEEEAETAGEAAMSDLSADAVRDEAPDTTEGPELVNPHTQEDPQSQAQENHRTSTQVEASVENPQSEEKVRAKARAKAKARARKAEKEEEKRRNKEAALQGIEEAAEIYNLTDPWAEVLITAKRIKDLRSSAQPQSVRGNGIGRTMNGLIKTYAGLARTPISVPTDVIAKLPSDVELLSSRLTDIKEFEEKAQNSLEKENTIRDVYEHSIPKMLKLGRAVLKARFCNIDSSVDAHRELCEMLKLARNLVELALGWGSQPHLEEGLGVPTYYSVQANLEALIAGYGTVIINEDRRLYRERLNKMQQADRTGIIAKDKKRKADAAALRRQQEEEAHAEWAEKREHFPTMGNLRHVVVVNNDIHAARPEKLRMLDRRVRYEVSELSRSQSLTRPSFEREATEEVLPSHQHAWTEGQTKVLLDALQIFTTKDRFQDIMRVYGGPNGELKDFDMDQVMAHARFLRQRLATFMSEQPRFDYNWLLSVP